ncbi:MAG: hypothetical protein C0624_00390 [Desulfuromonas sp.]|nr:MAG: hypothetical protein C0624_00390 [Desulfuromonas sp.]
MKMSCPSGMTLIELLVALTIAAVVLLMVQGVFLNASTLRETSRTESQLFHRSRVFFDRLERELGSTLYRQGHPYARFSLSTGAEQVLEFSSFAASPDLDGRIGGAALLRYEWRRADAGDGIELLRSEVPLQKQGVSPEPQSLAKHLDSVEVRCYDGERWTSQWDARQHEGLPRLLEVSFFVKQGETTAVPFRTIMEISSGSGS